MLVGTSSAEEVHWKVAGVRLDGTMTTPTSLGEEPLLLDVPSARRVLVSSYGSGGVATLDHGLPGVDAVAWEDRSHVLVTYGGTVVRCAASGVCHQILVSPDRVRLSG